MPENLPVLWRREQRSWRLYPAVTTKVVSTLPRPRFGELGKPGIVNLIRSKENNGLLTKVWPPAEAAAGLAVAAMAG